jgi:hypothetical protein
LSARVGLGAEGCQLKLISWNIAHRAAAWRFLAASYADVALLQEAGEPPADAAAKLATDAAPWRTGPHCAWRTAIINISNSAKLEWLTTALPDVQSDELGVSRLGTLAEAIVTPCAGEPFVAVSAYALWERSHNLAKRDFIYANASVHRLISDLSVFAGKKIWSRHSGRWRPQYPLRLW